MEQPLSEKQRPKRYWLTHIWCFLWNVTVAWPTTLLIRLLWGENLHWQYGLWCQLKENSWPVTPGKWPKGWYLRKREDGSYYSWGGTTLGHGGFIGPGKNRLGDEGIDTPLEYHEMEVHVEQYEASMFRSFLVGLIVFLVTGHWLLGLILAWSGYLLMGIANWSQAWIRGEQPYMGSHHEEAAYSRAGEYLRWLRQQKKITPSE